MSLRRSVLFDRSDAAVGRDGVRSPINYATSYLDLDFVYGRSEAESNALRTMENGLMNVTETGVPFQDADGTWLVRGCPRRGCFMMLYRALC